MAYDLIPFPISILFAAVCALAFAAVLWKLRKRDRIYSFLFKATLIIGIILVFAALYSVIIGMLG